MELDNDMLIVSGLYKVIMTEDARRSERATALSASLSVGM